jgi:hypothetical protein
MPVRTSSIGGVGDLGAIFKAVLKSLSFRSLALFGQPCSH